MSYKNVLLTGCSSGIGLALAIRLAKDELKRFRVFATMRNLEKRQALEEQAGESLEQTLEIRALDVTSEDSIRQCVASIPDRRVDVLVNNAGIGLIGPMESQSIGTMQRVFDTNFFGLARLVREIFPDMKRRRQGHIVVMSSILGLQGLLFNDVYCASKFAVEGFCESLALQALKFGVNISLIEPGPVVTEFERKLYAEAANMDLSGVDPETLQIFQGFYMTYSKEVFSVLGQTPEEVAEVHTALLPPPPLPRIQLLSHPNPLQPHCPPRAWDGQTGGLQVPLLPVGETEALPRPGGPGSCVPPSHHPDRAAPSPASMC
ncbi:retinol dehydrogenase 8-like isoform X1 [Ornithorhynchus anatinus]|uniref:retinol dehydrogenase 8-like isoform X1 n=1 Tax=Ornithorhynchus anatinus TaxID=9258 RepID=UPI0004541BB7|nr:retinol dehydrogenase 8-like isoform X1 [Ornithorhynchus anatinus]